MHIFISWSGNRAGLVAQALDVFLHDVMNDVTTFISQDLGGGTRWSEEIDRNLDIAGYGIVCLTKDRFRAPWINYEAGALGRAVPGKDRKRVVPLLLDSDNPSDVPQPLSLFNVQLSSKAQIMKLVEEIDGLVERRARADSLHRRAETAWPALEVALSAAKHEPEDTAKETTAAPSDVTTDQEKLDEILSFVRRTSLVDPLTSVPVVPSSPVYLNGVGRGPLESVLSEFGGIEYFLGLEGDKSWYVRVELPNSLGKIDLEPLVVSILKRMDQVASSNRIRVNVDVISPEVGNELVDHGLYDYTNVGWE